jgi:Fe2+ transport system protein FeoA
MTSSSLVEISVGKQIRFVDFSQDPAVYFRLLSLGIVPGDQAVIMGRAPFGGPISIRHGETNFLALRRNEAKTIIVDEVK